MTQRTKLSRKERQTQRSNQKRTNRILTALAAVAFVAILAFFTWQQVSQPAALPAADVPDPALGPVGAPVEIVEYADFGCPACRSWHNSGIRAKVLAQFGDQVRFVWKDFPVVTPRSPQAAQAGHCAQEQGQFWAFHDYVYENYAGLEEATLIQYAGQAGLDQPIFESCLTSGRMARKVQASDNEARRLGLRGTPGFVINGRPLPAPPSLEQLVGLINTELGK